MTEFIHQTLATLQVLNQHIQKNYTIQKSVYHDDLKVYYSQNLTTKFYDLEEAQLELKKLKKECKKRGLDFEESFSIYTNLSSK